MPKPAVIPGKLYGRLIAVEIVGRRPNRDLLWICKCECGAEKVIGGSNLITGMTRSCGCLRREKSPPNKTHGMSGKGEWNVWCQMRQRCNNPNNHAYHRYGGRGIRVCERWASSFEAFISDMGPRPSRRHTIERIDNNGDYHPGNCKWATYAEQSINTSHVRLLDYNGRILPIAEWSRVTGVNASVISARLKRGWALGQALEFEPRPSGRGRRPNRKRRISRQD